MGKGTVLVVDDDQDILSLIHEYLSSDGYEVITAADGTSAMERLRDNGIQLVILDIMLPYVDGIEVCRKIREHSNIPVVLLSAKSSDIDKVVGLRMGADDYIVKPFSMIELTARVEAQFRRYMYLNNPVKTNSDVGITIKGLHINEKSRSVVIFGTPVKLTKTEFDILLLLAAHPNRVFTLDEIYESVWRERALEGGSSTAMVHIARLRTKMGEQVGAGDIIQNVWGVGYKIEK
ncbi:response regulator transcription factor [Paenibacillus sp.]|jgi:DNA-binding response OmpR family regulator|uniref:response regulator transcription factor n=1 Tax=Paenibacillus sp. TaxID=58172 RepID=UPI002836D4A2|nr:response regulator transcription factor [Paenibacillus sp.]MDR0269163.1 response regulator transcription factor [Paenibacillus sp.]